MIGEFLKNFRRNKSSLGYVKFHKKLVPDRCRRWDFNLIEGIQKYIKILLIRDWKIKKIKITSILDLSSSSSRLAACMEQNQYFIAGVEAWRFTCVSKKLSYVCPLGPWVMNDRSLTTNYTDIREGQILATLLVQLCDFLASLVLI